MSSRIFFDTAPLIYFLDKSPLYFDKVKKWGVNSVEELLKACGPLVISIAVIPDFIYLPLAITAALLAGVLSLLVSWTEEKKSRQKSKRDAIEKAVKGIILIIDARIA